MKKAFTLAEVLITLTIIGVIAALTIPNLMQKWKSHQIYTALEKNYSILNNAFKLIEREYGAYADWSKEANAQLLFQRFGEHLKYAKKCENEKGCFKAFSNISKSYYFYGREWITSYSYILQDGTSLAFDYTVGDNMAQWGIIVGTSRAQDYITRRLGIIYVDINGPKNPNQIGEDVFFFIISPFDNNKYIIGLVPAGIEVDSSAFKCDRNNTRDFGGAFCTSKVLKEKGVYY